MEFTNPFETSFTEKTVVIDDGDASLPPDAGRRSNARAVTLPHVPLPHLSSHPSVGTTTAVPSNPQPRTLGRPGNVVGGAAANFSYPRVEGTRLSRHESNDSWSSVASSSVPGMVMDSSDSEVSSLEDDYCQYNASASELWDSFWPHADDGEGTRGKAEENRRSQGTTAAAKQPSSSSSVRPLRPAQEYFSCDLISHYTDDADDDTITIPPFGDKPLASATAVNTTTTTATGTGEETPQRRRSKERDPQAHAQPSPRSSPRRPASSKRAPATYSVYPKPQLPPPQQPLPRLPLPPRTSSLGPSQLPKPSSSSLPVFPVPPSSKPSLSSLVAPRQRRLRGSKSTHNLLLHLTPSSLSSSSSAPPSPPRPSAAGKTARSVPASPAYPPPPPPRALRPSVSVANLRDASGSETRHNVTAPLPSLAPSPAILPGDPLAPPPPPPPPSSEQQRFISVFELDSDAESIAENGGGGGSAGFAKRFMSRSGLHKKGAGTGGAGGKRRGSAPTTGTGGSASASNSSSNGTTTNPATTATPTVVVEFPDPAGFPAMVPASGVTRQPSPRRNRGGSLGRILGLKGR